MKLQQQLTLLSPSLIDTRVVPIKGGDSYLFNSSQNAPTQVFYELIILIFNSNGF